jgi:nitrile hydratase
MPAEHDHPHGHDHAHSTLGEMDLRVRALETLLTQKGYLDPAAVDRIIETYEVHVGPHNGAKVVARAWAEPAFRDWLLKDATAAIASMDYTGRQGEHMVAVPNTPETHNMVVCTLCSCYPWPILGLPPVWYKSAAYRSRTVLEPRKVLADFGVTLPQSTRIRVWDSTAELRYLVLPKRPAGTEHLSQAELASLVTRDAMIGTALV